MKIAGFLRSFIVASAASVAAASISLAQEQSESPWPADVPGFAAVQPGEHPRLLFRKSDLPKLKERTNTPEGQAILKRLRVTLNGSDGETMTTAFNPAKGKQPDGAGPTDKAPAGMYTITHAAGFGLLYQLTGDKKYAELGRQCFDQALDGMRDRDNRYSFRVPTGALRAGVSLGWYALGYDLCYDGWDEEYRRMIALALQDYNEGPWCSLGELALGKRQHPGSNHWGMEVGGGALALLAIVNDPGVDMKKIEPLLKASQEKMIVNMTQGFGDGGFFAEGDGTGSMSSHIVFLPALQAWRVAYGKDFVTPRPNAQWMSLKWIFLTVPSGDKSNLRKDFPERGAYPHNIWARDGKSGGGYFGIGCGVASDDQKAALLWFYNNHLKALDEKNNTPCDTPSPYPHHAILSFVNWPLGLQERNPGDILPHAYRDTRYGFYAWRNRWQDEDDVVISILTKHAKGNYDVKPESTLTIRASGKATKWGRISGGFTGDFKPTKDGSTILATGDGSCLAIDFSQASGAEGLLVMVGPGAPPADSVDIDGRKLSFLFLGKGAAPSPKVEGGKVLVGGQMVSYDGKSLVLEK